MAKARITLTYEYTFDPNLYSDIKSYTADECIAIDKGSLENGEITLDEFFDGKDVKIEIELLDEDEL